MTTTLSDNSPPADLDAPPADRDAQARWLLGREADIAARCRDAMRSAVVGAYSRFAAGLTAGALVAAGDLNELNTIYDQWLKFVHTELVDSLGQVHLSGAVTAWMGAKPGNVPFGFAEQFANVVNHNAESYMAGHLPKLANVGATTTQMVKRQVENALTKGLTNEQLKAKIEDVAKFSEFRADTIARTETIGAYVNGDMAGARALGPDGPVEKVWVATLDKRTRPTHAEAHNQCVTFEEMFDVGGVQMDAPHDEGAPPGEVVNCRCYVEQLYVGDTRPDGSVIEPAPGAEPAREPRWEAPTYDESIMPPLHRDMNAPNPGGGHAKYVMTDDYGNKYLFKPMDEWVAQGEAAASHIGRLAGLDDLPEVMVHQVDGQFGSLQKFIDNARPGFPSGQTFDPLKLTAADRELIMSHRPLDWLVGNHDAHVENWVREGYATQGGKLHGIDKGQAFKLFGKDKLSYTFNPNAVYGQSEPLYNIFERKWAKGELPQEFGNLFSSGKNSPQGRTLANIAKIDDREYRAILRPYAEGRYRGSPEFVERFLDDAVARKNGLDKQFSNYYYRLNNERKKFVGAPAKIKDVAMGGPGGPTGMGNAVRSKADDEWMRLHDSPMDRLTPHVASVQQYTGSDYVHINGSLRAGKSPPIAPKISAALGQVKTDMIVTRGTSLAKHMPLGDIGSMQGQVFIDRAFLSTTAGNETGATFGGDTLLHIKVPAGTRGSWVDPISALKGEDEFLLDQDLTYYVHSVRSSHGTGTGYRWEMDVEVVSRDWARANSRVWDANNKTWLT